MRQRRPNDPQVHAHALATRVARLSLSLLLIGGVSNAQEILNLDEISQSVQIRAQQAEAQGGWSRSWSPQRPIRIAILDNGFRGAAREIGFRLPRGQTVLRPGPVAINPESEEIHGTMMARLVAESLAAAAPDLPYQLHLFSAFGFSNFRSAVDSVIQERFDIVLYAQVWEFGGNGDGRGFINREVQRALNAGVLWINAAGNFGNAMYISRVLRGPDDWVRLPGPNSSVRVRCPEGAQQGRCQIRAVLAWNSFAEETTQGTDKDLDLVVTDDAGNIISSSALKQKVRFPEGEPGSSLYPREIATFEVPPGLSLIRVKIRSQDWNETDRLRITLSGSEFELLDRTEGETLLPPADLPGVIVVGASDSARSSRSARLRKPDVSRTSRVELSDGTQTLGTSNAAALTTALAAVELGRLANPAQVASRLNGSRREEAVPSSPGSGLCATPAPLPQLHESARTVLSLGGAVSVRLGSSNRYGIWRSRSAPQLRSDAPLAPGMIWYATRSGLVERSSSSMPEPGSPEYIILEEAMGWRICR